MGGVSGGPVRGRDQLADLLADHDGQNPIALKRDSQYQADSSFHYPMFQLAVEYLLDSEGGNRSLSDAAGLFADMADGTTFEEAFGRHIGMPLDVYEAEFFDRIDRYLPAHRNPLFTPLGIGLLVAALAAVGSGVLVAAGRRYRRDATPLARAGFYTSTVLGAAFAATVTAGILVRLGTTGNLYNAVETPGRHLASWLIVLFYAGALGLLVMTQRRWASGSRLAFLGLPMVVALFAVTIVAAGVML